MISLRCHGKFISIFFLLVFLFLAGCKDKRRYVYREIKPNYSFKQLLTTSDTIVFRLDTSTYNRVRSFNYFLDHDSAYVSFYDKQSLSLNIYNFKSQKLIKRVLLKEWLPGRKLKKKTTVFVKNFDSIFVINYFSLYRFDSSGNVGDSILLQRDPIRFLASFENRTPPIFVDKYLFIGAIPILSTEEKSHLKAWRVLYKIDLKNGTTTLEYELPEIYRQNRYNVLFFDNGYCYNQQGKFVFSFPPDSNIYETNLSDHYNAYYGKSQFQKLNHVSNEKDDASTADGIQKKFLLSNTYGPIYFDPFTKCYMRVSSSALTESEYNKKEWQKEQSVILFDENFRIVGESRVDKNVLLSSLFFTSDGNMYARTRIEDEYNLHFVRLTYSDNSSIKHLGRK